MKTVFFFLWVLLAPLNLHAAPAQESETEKRVLIVIANELEQLKALTHKAKATKDARQRVQFDYAALQRDLQDIQTAIENHVNKPSRSPRVISTLNASYTQVAADE